jgi:hypothetical protein
MPYRQETAASEIPMLRFLKLTERHDETQSPANNLALAVAFSGVGLLNALLQLTLGSLAYTLHLWQ